MAALRCAILGNAESGKIVDTPLADGSAAFAPGGEGYPPARSLRDTDQSPD